MSTEQKNPKQVCLYHGSKELSCSSGLPKEEAMGGCRGTPMLQAYVNTWQCFLGNEEASGSSHSGKIIFGQQQLQNYGNRHSMSL